MPEHDDDLSTALQDYYRAMAQQPAPDVTGRVMMSADRRNARIRRWGAIAGGAVAAAAVGAVVAVALVNHNQPALVGPAHSATPAPTASIAPPTVSPSPLLPVAAPPVRGFVPTDVTAVSADEWWVLGYNGPSCASASCTRIVHTTDGGHTFASIPVPPVAPGVAGKPDRLRFADQADAWLVSSFGNVWATHDGGNHWVQNEGTGFVTDLEASGGAVYAIECEGAPSCTLERSSVGQDSWSTLPASNGHGDLAHLTVNGAHLWVAIASPAGGPGSLLASTDGGQHFTMQTACPSALGYANQYAVGASTLWATCATGTEASAFRSVDGGQQFTQLSGPTMLPNFASIAGVSSTTAVIGAGTLLRTVDGGQRFVTVESAQGQWTMVGFTTQLNGFAFGLLGFGQSELWRSNDAGASWYQVQFP